MSAVRKSYSLEVKLSAIEMAKRSDNMKAAKHFEVDDEDHLIHCIKPDGPIPSGRAALEESGILDGSALEEALVLDDEDAALLDVTDSDMDDGDGSGSDVSFASESSPDADGSIE
ncbi:hypothetical protein AAVH_43382, partial [Aphelenchoides avenae]